MKLVKHIVEPEKLVVLWQAVDDQLGKAVGERFVVGEITNAGADSKLTYFDNNDTKKAQSLGFRGLTAYPFEANKTYNGTVESVLAKRLPPDSRGDYENFLLAYRVSPEAAKLISPLALLAYTTGNLMGDGFSFYPVYNEKNPPVSFTLEIAGFRHNGHKQYPDPRIIKDKQITFELEDTNPFDNLAVRVMLDSTLLGYVPKGLQTTVRALLMAHRLVANVERINGTLERPNILVFVEVAN